MLVSRVSITNNLKSKDNYYKINQQKRYNVPPISPTINSDTIQFKSTNKVIENLIVKDLSNYHHYLKDMNRFSSNLKKTGQALTVTSNQENGITSYLIKNPIMNSFIRINIDENKYKNVKPGFIFGKTGFYGTLNVTEENGKNYIIEIHENSEFNNKNGIQVINKKIDDLSFKGKNPTTTVNAYYKSEKTIKSVQRFFKLIKESQLFNTIEKATKPYYEDFHPYLLAGGFGSRLEALSFGRKDNKPSTATPIKGMDLMHFSLLNLYQANLLPNSTDDIDFVIQDEANSAVGCVITTLGYKIQNNTDGVDLVKDGKSILPKDKAVVILPSDNVIDINLAEVLDSYNKEKNVGMMVVGVPDYRCYGGLIRSNENNEIKEFIYKPTIEYLEKNNDFIHSINSKGEKEYLLNNDGQKTALGNAFIYIINQEILDSVASIYKNKIRNAYETLAWSKGGTSKDITQEEYLKVIECLWDREIIPELVSLSNENKLKNNEGENLRILVYKALETSYSDVGECQSYIATMKNIAQKDTFINIPKSIKKEVSSNIINDTIFNTDVKNEYKTLLGGGFTTGNIIVIPSE